MYTSESSRLGSRLLASVTYLASHSIVFQCTEKRAALDMKPDKKLEYYVLHDFLETAAIIYFLADFRQFCGKPLKEKESGYEGKRETVYSLVTVGVFMSDSPAAAALYSNPTTFEERVAPLAVQVISIVIVVFVESTRRSCMLW